MLEIYRSSAPEPSSRFRERPRKKGEDNVAWLERCRGKDDDRTTLLLVGGRDALAVRLRVAQSHARHDLTPSSWSHVLLLGSARKRAGRTPTSEIALDPARGFGFPPSTNAIQSGTVARYRDPEAFPNIGCLVLPVPRDETDRVLGEFRTQRNVLDAIELVLRWLSFAWGVGRTGNPLLEGYGLPSAALVEYVVQAAGLELTPGLASRSSCPEAIWQTARWWHPFFESEGRAAKETPRGAYCRDHIIVPE